MKSRALIVLALATTSVAFTTGCASTPTKPPPVEAATVHIDAKAAIDQASLGAWAQARFADRVATSQLEIAFGAPGSSDELLAEIRAFGLATIGDLDAIVPADFETRGAASFAGGTNVVGLVRDLMIIKDVTRYASQSFKANTWCACESDFPAPKAYGVDLAPLGAAGVFECCPGGGHDQPGGDEGGGDDRNPVEP